MFFVAFSPSGNGGAGIGGGAQEGRFEVVAHVAAHVPARPVLVYQAIDRSSNKLIQHQTRKFYLPISSINSQHYHRILLDPAPPAPP